MTTTLAEDGTFQHTPGSEVELQAVNEVLGRVLADNYRMEEQLANIELMIDDRGWSPIYEYGNDSGLTLRQVKTASKQLRELVIGNPFVKQGSELRSMFVWAGGLEFSTKRLTTAKPAKLTDAVLAAMQLPANKKYVFSASAQIELERAAFTDGNIFMLGDMLTKTFQRVPISEIKGDLRNPDNPEEIWAYRRAWSQNPQAIEVGSDDIKEVVRWYFTDVYPGQVYSQIQSPLFGLEKVDIGKRIIDQGFNRQIGWAYGVPDALAIISWARLYKEFLVNGYVMSRAMARFAYRVTTSSTTGSANVAQQVTLPGQAGQVAVQGTGNDLSAMPQAGKGYDFTAGRPLGGATAAGLGLSLDLLMADGEGDVVPSAVRWMAQTRRRQWNDWWDRIFDFLGNKAVLCTTWVDLTDDQIQRVLQAITLTNASGLFKGEVIQPLFAKAMKISDPGAIPDGYQTPNNKFSFALPSGEAPNPGEAPTPATGDDQGGTQDGKTAAPSPTTGSGQGKSTGRGKAPNDHSTD